MIVFFVYAIYHHKTGKIYIGQTCDIDKRMGEHNDPANQKHVYTKRVDTGWKLIYYEEVSTRSNALKREKQLKSYQGRLFIKSKINIPL